MNEKCILKINDLSFGYQKEKLIYKNFNLELNRGEIVSIVGESGSGKSTLFELISNNLIPLNGTIKTKKIASIYQDPYSSFHPTFSIKEQIDDVVNSYDKQEFEYFLDLSKSLLLNKEFYDQSAGCLFHRT